jgi:hypothetical protein
MRLPARVGVAIALGGVASIVHADCTANTSSTDDLQRLLTEGGQGYKLSLCAGQTYTLDKILNYTAVGQVGDPPPPPRKSVWLSCRRYQQRDIRVTAQGRRCSSTDSM